MDERESVSNCRFMVVFQYGSAILFNVDDNDVERYLDIVRRHASGLLTDMRKDGQCPVLLLPLSFSEYLKTITLLQ